MHEIIPGILEKEWSEIERKIELVRPFAKTIHIDIIDGKFAPNTTFIDPKPFLKYSKDIFFELHMMVEEPINYLKPWAEAGFRRFLGHVEKMSNQEEFLAQGQLLGEVGLALDGPTPVDGLNVPLDDLDALLVMTIKAGLSGQEFMSEHLEKIKMFSQNTWVPIEVDGGINDKAINEASESGATRFVSTSFLFKGDPLKQYKILQGCLENSK